MYFLLPDDNPNLTVHRHESFVSVSESLVSLLTTHFLALGATSPRPSSFPTLLGLVQHLRQVQGVSSSLAEGGRWN